MNRMKRSGSAWIRFILRRRLWILAIFVILTAFWGYRLQDLQITRDVGVMFPPDHPNMQLSKAYKKMLATPDKLICILEVKKGDIYTREAIARIHRLTQSILYLPGCDASDIKSITETSVKHMAATAWGVETHPVIFPKMPETREDFDRLRKKVETDPGIRGVFVSYDGRAAAIMARWKKGDNLGKLYQDLGRLSQAESNDIYKVHFAGAPALGANMIHLTGQIKTAVIWMLAALVIVLALYLRSITGILLSLATLVLSAVWALGLAVTLSLPISFLAMVWVLFLGGASTAFAAFCFHSCSAGNPGEKQSVIDTVFGNLLAPVTTGLIVFGLSAMTLTLTTVPLLSQAGYMGGCWALATFCTIMIFNPMALSFLPVPKPRLSGFKNRGFQCISPIGAILLAFILLAGGAISAGCLNVGDNEPGSAFFFPDNPYNQAFSFFNKKFIGGYNMTIIVEGRDKGVLNDLETMTLIDDFQNFLKDETDARAAISITMMIKTISRLYHEGNPKWALIPADKRERSALGGAIKMGGSAGKWMDDTWTNGSIQAMFGSDDNELIKNRLVKARAFINSHPSDNVNFRLFAGFLGAIAAMNDAGHQAYWISLCGAALLAFLTCLAFFRTVKPGMIILLSMAAAQGATWIYMAFRGISISIHSLPAAPLSLGFGAALGICLINGMGQMGGQFPGTPDDRITKVNALTGALAFTGLVPAVMILPFAWLDLKFMAEAGGLLGVSVLAQTITAIILLPCLAAFFKLDVGKIYKPQY